MRNTHTKRLYKYVIGTVLIWNISFGCVCVCDNMCSDACVTLLHVEENFRTWNVNADTKPHVFTS